MITITLVVVILSIVVYRMREQFNDATNSSSYRFLLACVWFVWGLAACMWLFVAMHDAEVLWTWK